MPPTHATQRPPIVLIANDYEWSGRSLETVLTPRGYAVVRAFTGTQALQAARTSQPDAVIVEERLPDFGGIALCSRLHEDGLVTKSTPILVTSSGRLTHEQIVAAYAAGAWDVCLYPLDAEILALRLGTFIAAKRDADRARDESLIDPSTGFYNIRGLVRRGREMAAEALRGRTPLACLAVAPSVPMADADETDVGEGGQESFRTARALGQALLRCVRASDVVGHLGRAEFAIIARNTTPDGAAQLTRRMRAALNDTTDDLARRDLGIRASYFAVPNYAETALDTLEMLERASASLHGGGPGATGAAAADLPIQSPPAS